MKKGQWTFIIGLVVGIIAWGISLAFSVSHPGKILELKGLDYLFYVRGGIPPPEDMIIVGIDESSFSELKLPWPWPRRLHAQLIEKLTAAGARVIGFDILFADPTTEKDDTSLTRAIREAGNVVLASEIIIVSEHEYGQVTETEPLPVFRNAAAGVGACTLIYDPDNIIRRSQLTFGRIRSFIYEVLSLSGINRRLLEDISDENILINFIGPSRSIKTVSYYQALAYRAHLPRDIFKDKIVLIGRTLTASPDPRAKQPDTFSTPRFPDHQAQMAGVEIIANFIDTVSRNRHIRQIPVPYIYLVLLLFFLALAAAGIRITYLKNLLLTILFTALYGMSAHFFFAYRSILLPVFLPIAGSWLVFGTCSLTKYILVEKEKKYIKNAFQKYVPPAVVKEILAAPEKLRLGGEQITGTVFFSDLANFTTISEKLEPEKLVSFINEYLSEMTDIVFEYHGTLTRYMGDAILAIWGAPVRQRDHALRSVLAAMKMKDKLRELNIGWKSRSLPELSVRIGLNTGQMTVGNVGSEKHMDYTPMGDNVNLASRLEGANKFYGTCIIIGHSTYQLVSKDIKCRPLDNIRVKGRKEPLEIYEPITSGKKHDKETDSFLYPYNTGLDQEKNRRWPEAVKSFREALTVRPDDTPARLHLERCQGYQENPPPRGWDGIHNLTEK